jgi:hypothetical protein
MLGIQDFATRRLAVAELIGRRRATAEDAGDRSRIQPLPELSLPRRYLAVEVSAGRDLRSVTAPPKDQTQGSTFQPPVPPSA